MLYAGGMTEQDTPPDPEAADESAAPPGGGVTLTTFRDALDWTHDKIMTGEIWVGWTSDGRFAFGDTQSPPEEGIVPVDAEADPDGATRLAGAVALQLVNNALAQQRNQAKLMLPNREQRRAAAQRGRRAGAGAGLILPGVSPRP